MRGSRLVIPACLAVTTLQLGCPGDTSPEGTSTTSGASTSTSTTDPSTSTSSTSGADSSSTTTSTTTTTTTTTDASTDATGETSGSESSDGSETGTDLPDCAMFEDTETCNAMPGCLWDDVVGQCDVDCTLIEDMAQCVDQTGVCYWLDGACYHVAI